MYFHNTCTRNSDQLIFFFETDDADKMRMLSHAIFNTFKKCNWGDGNLVKNDGGGEIVVVFTITEINYLG